MIIRFVKALIMHNDNVQLYFFIETSPSLVFSWHYIIFKGMVTETSPSTNIYSGLGILEDTQIAVLPHLTI